jgi:hypothetical protein
MQSDTYPGQAPAGCMELQLPAQMLGLRCVYALKRYSSAILDERTLCYSGGLMKAYLLAALLFLCGASLLAQGPADAPATAASRAYSNDVGFSYSFPADWDVVDMSATLPAAQQQAQQSATSDAEKRGAACTQIALSARHGSPASTVVAVVLPFSCLGAEMTDKDLPGMGSGAMEGIQQSFDIAEPVYGVYSLGSHSVWIERAKGSLKGHSEVQYTVETVCSIMKKGAVCWMAIAADDAALQTFEHGAVTLESEAPTSLVPVDAFVKKPS